MKFMIKFLKNRMLRKDKKIRYRLKGFLAVYILFILISQSIVLAHELIVKDSQENLLTIETPVRRVVSLVPSATEVLFEIGAEDAVAGITYHDSTLKGGLGKQIIGGFFYPSIEKIKQIKPDMLILSSFHKKMIEKFKNSNCPVFIYDTDSIEQSYQNTLTLGKIFDCEAGAEKIIGKNKARLEYIAAKLAKAVPGKRKRVIRLMGRDTVMTPGADSFQNEMIRKAGGIPPDFGKKGSIVKVEKKEWLAFNPEVIYGCGGDRKTAEKFFSLPGWKDVDAVKNHQVYYFPCELTCRAATHTGYFVSWLSSVIYTDEFANPKNNISPIKIIQSKPVEIDLDYIKSASIKYSRIYDFENKTLVIDFLQPQTIVSTLEGQRSHILTVGNHYTPPPTWAPGHKLGIDHIRSSILKAVGKNKETASFLMTGADMDNLSVTTRTYRKMKVVALVTAGVMSNAVRMSKDKGNFYEPGTINIIILTNMHLSKRAMTRAIISATEAKTAVLEDLDIRSAYTPLKYEATGTGTDNMIVVQGEGSSVDNAGGHSKMGELIAKAVYSGVRKAILKQNKITPDRNIFQRLKERRISVFDLASGLCDCMNQKSEIKNTLAGRVEHLLLEPRYASFVESALAMSDEYQKGRVKDTRTFKQWCQTIARDIAGKDIEGIKELVTDKNIPIILKTALNAIFTGALENLNLETEKSTAAEQTTPQRVVSLSPIITETIYLLGAEDKLIADTTYCRVPEQAMQKEKIGSVTQMNVEKIIRLRPDLVIASALSREKQLQILDRESIKVKRTRNPKTFQQMCDMTLDLGRVLGKESNAIKIIEKAKTQVETIFEKTKLLSKPRVFIQIGMKPLHSANKEMFINEYIRYGGGINIAEDESSGIYSREKVIEQNPQVILIATMGTSKKAGELEKQRWMSFGSISAVKNKKIFVLDPETICSPTPVTFVNGLKSITALIHPELVLSNEK